MFETIQSQTQASCAAHCFLDNSCTVFQMTGTTCYMGHLNHGGGHIGDQPGISEVFVKRGNISIVMNVFHEDDLL